MPQSFDEKAIPTLDELIAPGSREGEPQTNGKRAGTHASHAVPVTPQASKAVEHHKPKGAFEVAIEAMVTEILNRHMENARREITQNVLSEVRARLHDRPKPNFGD